jgi:hypothetical protein
MDDDGFLGLLKAFILQPFQAVVFFVTLIVIVWVGVYFIPKDANGVGKTIVNPTVHAIVISVWWLGGAGLSWVTGRLATYGVRKKWGTRGVIVANLLTLLAVPAVVFGVVYFRRWR